MPFHRSGEPSTDPKIGRKIGHYRVMRELGSGGMAQVLLVEDTRTHCLRALKLHHPRILDESTVLRFKREYRALGRLKHRSVVQVHDYGVDDNLPYMVMDYVQGESITDYVEKRAPVIESSDRAILVAKLCVQVASALEHVHASQLVHRDLKPENILVSADGQVTLIDFGVAKSGDESLEITESGVVLGTLAYASPEQVSGRVVDARSDLYSLGIILYELLTGHRPFVAEHIATYILKHVTEAPIPVEQYNPTAPDDLIAICNRLLKKQPQQRYRTAGILADHFAQALSHLGAAGFAQAPTEESQATSHLFEPTFVGRIQERREFLAELDALERGRGGVFFLAATAGMGKARLLHEVRSEARIRGIRVLRTQYHGPNGAASQGMGELLGHLIGQLSRGTRRPKLSAHTMAAFPNIVGYFDGVPPKPSRVDESTAVQAIIDDILRVLELAVQSPLVITVEHAHFADARAIHFLQQVIDATQGSHIHIGPIFWVISFQSDELNRSHPLQSYVYRDKPIGRLLQLGALSQDDVNLVVESMLGPEAARLLAPRLFRVSEGNPLFLTETIRQLVDSGYLSLQDSEFGAIWQVNASVELPESLTEVLRRRVNSLDGLHFQLIEICSVLGGAFSAPLMLKMLDIEEVQLLDFVDRMLQRHFLVERQSAHGIQYRFVHPRLRQLLYRSLPRARQIELHRQAAVAHLDGPLADEAEIIAAHYFAAGDFEEGANHLLGHARKLIASGASLEALRLLKRADECVYAGGSEIQQETRFGVALKLATVLGNLGEVSEAMVQFKKAFGIAKVMDEAGWRGETLYLIGRLYQQIGDYRRSSRYYYRGMRLCSQAGEHAMMLRSLNGLAGVLWRLGDDRRASRLFEEVLQLSRRIGSIMAEAAALNGMGLLAVHRGEFSRSARLFTTSRDLHTRSDRHAVALLVELNIASSERVMGQLGPARLRGQGATEELERLGHHLTAANGWLLESELALDIGELSDVEPALERSAQLGSGQSLHQVGLGAVRGRLLATKGNMIDGIYELSRALAIARRIDMPDFTVPLLISIAHYQIQLGSSADAQSLLKEALELAGLRNRPVERANAQQVMALSHMRRGHLDLALKSVHEAYVRHGDAEMRLEMVKDGLILGELYLEDGELEAAQGVLREAMLSLGEIRAGLDDLERQAFAGKEEVSRLAKLWAQAGLGGHF